jgi:hypothetical protein
MVTYRSIVYAPVAVNDTHTLLQIDAANATCTGAASQASLALVSTYFGQVITDAEAVSDAEKLAAITGSEGYAAIKAYKADKTEITVTKTTVGMVIRVTIPTQTNRVVYLDVPVVSPGASITNPPTGETALTPTGVVPGHYHNASVTVGVDGRLTFAESNTVSGIPDGCVDAPGNPQSGIPDRTPVALYNGQLVAANAAAPSYMPCVGFYQGSSEHIVRVSGKEAGFTGLVANTTYYVASGGGITSTPPTGNVVQRVGKALDTTTLFVQLGEPVA